jgi:hypothetical protein
MPNYIINECITNDVYILSAATLTSGATVEFGISETPFCGTVGAVTLSAETLNIYFLQLYDDCCACLEGDGRESLHFHFTSCNDLEEINIEATNFCLEYGLPTTGQTYEIQFDSETSFCATFVGLAISGETNYSYVSGGYANCEDCKEGPFIPPISANTESTICQEVCDNSVITIIPLHPIYINSAGQEVVQMNAVLIGGNGLNG